jgi:hypothetical protein
MKILSIESIEVFGLETQKMPSFRLRSLINIEHCGSQRVNLADEVVKMPTMLLESTLVVLDAQPRL